MRPIQLDLIQLNLIVPNHLYSTQQLILTQISNKNTVFNKILFSKSWIDVVNIYYFSQYTDFLLLLGFSLTSFHLV